MPIFKNKLSRLAVSTAVMAAWMSTGAHADVTARYGELQAVIDAVNDPDPLMRLAQLEEILQKGNATEVQLAIRTAFSVDDPNVRSLALRAHFAGFRTFIVSAALPDNIKKAVEGSDKKAAEDAMRGDLMRYFSSAGYHFSFRSEYPESSALEFKVNLLNNKPVAEEPSGSGNIRGGLITIVTALKIVGTDYSCSFEFTEYEAFTLKGFGACNIENSFLFPVTLHLFDSDKPPVQN
ncbi:hypothetical protein GYN07_27150 (plasmid) [Rhizobium leguminosarum bv. viciae 248]|uniref:hypothetical protein n=1 Tax=Rhizobium leguminosarum TaxID=384 RepID=UPI000477E806|nr:hypothetical protein [Rhizobium leguminosarum]MCA2406624.1 hypothetical protein [Rhizobium leguminosarum]NKM59443.1 hypothetical protein [Rhizobium leguminosarum bv. viciae]QHW27999.1 hypothetical protein GYN07_27150 [Rhizobium leguminosarum bv. viciae 248]